LEEAGSMRNLAYAVVALAVVFAGCTNAPTHTATPSNTLPSTIVHGGGDNDTGIHGQVRNDELSPIKGAKVGLVELSLQLSSNDEGAFDFKALPAGKYRLVAEAIGYEGPVAKAVEVVAGSTAQVQFTMTPLPVVTPYNLTTQFRGRVACGLAGVSPCAAMGLLDLVNQPDPSGNKQGMNWTYKDGAYPDAVVIEVVWKPVTGASGQKLSWEFFTSTDGLSRQDVSATGTNSGSPIYVNATQAQLKAAKAKYNSDFQFILYPDSGAATVQQDFTIYRTDFYNGPAPTGFHFVAADA
jgi:hypothetical protein